MKPLRMRGRTIGSVIGARHGEPTGAEDRRRFFEVRRRSAPSVLAIMM